MTTSRYTCPWTFSVRKSAVKSHVVSKGSADNFEAALAGARALANYRLEPVDLLLDGSREMTVYPD